MKVLFIGGNGNISWWCVEEAIRRGDEVYELNRKMTRATRRKVQPEVHEIIADIRNEEAAVKALSEMSLLEKTVETSMWYVILSVLMMLRQGRQ